MIPRIFHRIWVGSNPLPESHERYGETWQRHHPAWEMRLWTEENLPELTRPEGYDRMRNPSERGDLLRYEILRSFGGVYIDTDYECLKPIDELVEGVDFFVGYIRDEPYTAEERATGRARSRRIGSAIIGSAQGHPVMERAVREAKAHEVFGHNKTDSGPVFLDRLLRDFPDVTRYPLEYLYPQTPEEEASAYAVHHEARAWRTHAEMNENLKRSETKLREVRQEIAGHELEIKRLRRELKASEARRKELKEELARAPSGALDRVRAGVTNLRGRRQG